MRKTIATWVGAAGLTLTLAAGAAGQTLKITYPGWDSKEQEREVTAIFAAYEKQNPGVKIELISTPFPVMKQKLVVSLRSGDAPDLGYLDGRWLPELQAAGFLADVTAQANALDRKDWYPAAWEPATIDGKVYGIPTASTRGWSTTTPICSRRPASTAFPRPPTSWWRPARRSPATASMPGA